MIANPREGRMEIERRGNVFRVRATAYGFIRVARVCARRAESPPVTPSRRLRNLIKVPRMVCEKYPPRERPYSPRLIVRLASFPLNRNLESTCRICDPSSDLQAIQKPLSPSSFLRSLPESNTISRKSIIDLAAYRIFSGGRTTGGITAFFIPRHAVLRSRRDFLRD